MDRRTEATVERAPDPRRGQTWHEIWVQQVRGLRQATTHVTRGEGTKQKQPGGTTPLERDDPPIDQGRSS